MSEKILYECDRRKCENCNMYCSHTEDIEHAINFINEFDSYCEVERPLSANRYHDLALRTESTKLSGPLHKTHLRLLQGLMGLSGEAGEAIDILKKHLFQGHPYDRERIARELGDVAWYLVLSADAIGYSLESIFRINIEKLQNRYPEGFDPKKSINRDERDI